MGSILVGSARIAISPDMSGFLGDLQSKVRTALASLNAEVPIKFTVSAASVAAARAALGPLGGQTVPVKFKVDPASVAAAKAALGPIAGETVPIRFVVDSAGVASVVAADKVITGAATSAAAAQKTLNASTTASATGATAAAVAQRVLAGNTTRTTVAANTAGTAVTRLGRALAGRNIALFGGAFGTTGILASVGAIHLLADAVIEVAAVVIPAGIALAAFGVAAVPTIQQLTAQWTNLNVVQDAFSATIAPATGGLARMAAAVKPEVYALFGAGLTILNSKIGVFEKLAAATGAALDNLASRSQLAIASAGAGQFLSHAVQDVAKLGDVVGNIFGIVGNLLKTMPGYAEVLLNILDGVTHGLEVITGSGIVQGLIRGGLAFHGFALYGGLAVTAVSLLAPLLARAGTWAAGITTTATATGQLAANASRLDKTKAAFTDLGLAASGMQVKIVRAADGTATLGREAATGANVFQRWGGVLLRFATNPWTWAVVAAVAVGFLAEKLFSARDATQAWAASLQDTISRQVTISGVTAATAAAISKVDVATRGAQSSVKALSSSTTSFGASQQAMNQQTAQAAHNVSTLQGASSGYSAELRTQRSRAADLVTIFGSQAKAEAVLNALHINAAKYLTEVGSAYAKDRNTAMDYFIAVKAVIQMSGLAAAGTGRYNAALNALNNTFLTGALPNIQKVTAAEDALMTVLLGGRQAFTTFQQDMHTIGTDSKVAGAHLSGLGTASLTLAADFYSTVVPAGQKLIDSLQQQGISTKHLGTAVADEAKQMIPFAGKNVEARAVIVSLINNALGPGTVSLKNLNSWVRQNSGSLRGFNAIVAQSTIQAGTLASTLKNDLNAQFRADLLVTSGASAALKVYTSDLVHNRDQTAAGRGDRLRLITDLVNSGLSAKQARDYVSGLQKNIDALHGKTVKIDVTGLGQWSVSQSLAPGAGHRRAAGGLLTGPGTPTSDSIPLWGSTGEYMMKAAAVSKYGVRFFDKLNTMQLAGGGVVGNYAGTVRGEGPWTGREYAATTVAIEEAVAAATAAGIKKAMAAFGSLGAKGGSIVADAMQWIGKIPYVWGGTAVPGGADCCLAGDSEVLTAGGPKPIMDVCAGDVVWTWDQGRAVAARVVRRSEPRRQDTYRVVTASAKLQASGNHPFLVAAPGGYSWTEVDDLTIGDLVVRFDCGQFRTERILAIEPMGPADTYDITVEDTHNFVAEGLVVHNSGFTSTIYARHGISAPRTSEAQGAWVRQGAPTPGGLAFYNSPAGGPPPGHVAIVGNNGMVISQGGGLGPQYVPLRSMPLMFTGVPPGGLPKAASSSGRGNNPIHGAKGIAKTHTLDQGGWLYPGEVGLNLTSAPELVLNASQLRDLGSGAGPDRALHAKLDQLIAVAKAIPAGTGGAVGDALNGVARSALSRGRYSPR